MRNILFLPLFFSLFFSWNTLSQEENDHFIELTIGDSVEISIKNLENYMVRLENDRMGKIDKEINQDKVILYGSQVGDTKLFIYNEEGKIVDVYEIKIKESFNFFADFIGKGGVVVLVFLIMFGVVAKNSEKIFQWIENQTFGTRDYILQKLDLLIWEVKPDYITYGLLFLSFGLGVLAFGICAIFGKIFWGFILALIISFVGWKIPRPFFDYLVERRIKLFQLQMVDALNLLANGLRAGLSLPQSVGMVVDELPAPVSEEFNLILQQNKIGVPLDECFENLNKRIPTEDNEMFVTSIGILRETGGNLAEVFDTITDVIRERVRLQQKIDTYVAQGKFQGGTIFCMPFVMLLLFGMSDPDSIMPLFTTWPGRIALFIAMLFNLAGGYAILKVIKIKV